MTTMKKMQAAAKWDTGFAKPESEPPVAGAARGSAPTLKGHWRHSHGLIFCGTLRIAREDFDTNPHPDFRDKVFDEICAAMNRAQNKQLSETDNTK
jgi:hypothetical protein